MAYLSGSTTPWPEDTMENYKWLDDLLQSRPGTEKVFQSAWQAYKYMLRGKMYAYIGVNDQNKRPIITLKLEPVYSEMLRRQYADIVPGFYMNKLYWSTVYLDGEVPKEALADMVCASHRTLLFSLSNKARTKILNEILSENSDIQEE